MKADGFASPWESAMKHGFVPLLCQNGVNCTGMSVKYRSTYLCRLEQVVVDDVSRRFQTESSARRETIIARLTRIFNGDRHSYPSLFLSNTKIYSSLRYFQIFISLTKNKVLLKKIIIINISISQIRFYVKMVSMKTWYIYVCFAKFLLLSTILWTFDHSTCALNYRYLINFVTIVSRCPCMESVLPCYSIRPTILFNTSRWQFTI